jgi:tetratricopeptide (TPR) repeat protein
MTFRNIALALVCTQLSVGALGSSVYDCLQQPDQGPAQPQLTCSDLEAEKAFQGIAALFDKNKNTEALQFLETLVAAKPFSTQYRIALIEKRIALSEMHGVENHITVLAQLNPNSQEALFVSARAFEKLGKYDDAIALISTHLETHPWEHELRRLRARFFEKREKWQQAQSDWLILERAKIPSEEKIQRLRNYLKVKLFTSAIEELEPGFALDKPGFDHDLADILAQAYYGVERFSDAETIWKAILKTQPENSETRIRLAKALIERKQYEDAITHLSRVLTSHEGHPTAIYQLSKVRILQERFDLAGQALAQLSNSDPSNTWSVQAQAQLLHRLGQTPIAESFLKAKNLDSTSLNLESGTPSTERVITSALQNPCMQHLVHKGETLESISLIYFKDRSAWRSLLGPNAKTLSNPHQIKEGTTLWIPQNRETAQCGE